MPSTNLIQLSTVQKTLLLKIIAARTSKIAYDEISTGEKNIAARDFLLSINFIHVDETGAELTQMGNEYLVKEALISPSNELTDAGRKLATMQFESNFSILKSLEGDYSDSRTIILDWYGDNESTAAELFPFIEAGDRESVVKLINIRVKSTELAIILIDHFTMNINAMSENLNHPETIKNSILSIQEKLPAFYEFVTNELVGDSDDRNAQQTFERRLYGLIRYNYNIGNPEEFMFSLKLLLKFVNNNFKATSPEKKATLSNYISSLLEV